MYWVARRVARALGTVVVVVNLSFLLIYYLPGGPMEYLISMLYQNQGGNVDMEELEGVAEAYLNVNPNAGLQEQYVDYMSSLLVGDLGQSIWFQEPVADLLAQTLPWTLFVMLISILLTFALGVLWGIVMAYYEGTNFDFGSTTGAIVFNSIPYYVLAILMVFILGYLLEWFPVSGRMNNATTPGLNWAFISGVLHHAALPIASIVVTGVGGWALAMRGNSIRVLGQEYLRVARLRGLPNNVIMTKYVGRNSILPLYTQLMIGLGYMFGGSVILEQIFFYQGVGFYLFRAVSSRDYTLMMGAFIVITVAVIIGVLVAELTYGWIDPRAREGGAQNEQY